MPHDIYLSYQTQRLWKITIELTEVEVRALKAYIKETTDVKRPGKEDIKTEIRGMVDSCMQSGAIGDYYQQFATH